MSGYQCGVCFGWHTNAGDCAGPVVIVTTQPDAALLYPRDCVHGHLARSCELCEKDDTIAALRAENEELRAENERLRNE